MVVWVEERKTCLSARFQGPERTHGEDRQDIKYGNTDDGSTPLDLWYEGDMPHAFGQMGRMNHELMQEPAIQKIGNGVRRYGDA